MFTGIVEETGTIRKTIAHQKGMRLEIDSKTVLCDAKIGDSIAVNGCCLTVVEMANEGLRQWWAADAVAETLQRTNLQHLKPGDRVNLERALKLNDRLGGHLVQGHVDGIGILETIQILPDGSHDFIIAPPPSLLRYVVKKGSITLDGVSLTVCLVDERTFSVTLIPHTRAVTTLGQKTAGALLNIEVDLLAKYVEKLSEPFRNVSNKENLS
ncbi:riboflavin synthase [Parachlamydia sp. AcF125]|uniref:riboflavin synthase n=1 Tax=Parachlamydia sp. AcF125 TaxID=2795736 RepID=UPI001BC97D9B|nr:riboflavin synthase [Parachlamydia sp. AcF125]MBS4168443.1 Riboflavin synthase [Parachlamydia sp. AcF125]